MNFKFYFSVLFSLLLTGEIVAQCNTNMLHHFPFTNNSWNDVVGDNLMYGSGISPDQDRFGNAFGAKRSNGGGNLMHLDEEITGDEVSISMWIKRLSSAPTTQQTFSYIMNDDTESGNTSHLVLDNGLSRLGMRINGTFHMANSNGVIPANDEWYHVVFSAGEGFNLIYVNGVLALNYVAPDAISLNDFPVFRFFNHATPMFNNGWQGGIDDIHVINKVLNPDEVQFMRGFQNHNILNNFNFPCVNVDRSFGPSYVGNIDPSLITHQWFKDGVAVSGQEAMAYSLTPVQSSDAGMYQLFSTLNCITLSSNEINISVGTNYPPVITTQPQDIEACEGEEINVIVDVDNATTYQWYKDNQFQEAITFPSWNHPSITLDMSGEYYLRASNSCGVTESDRIDITVKPSLVITQQPIDAATVCENETLTLETNAVGENVSYQWKKDGANVFGANGAVLTINNFNSSQAGSYTCEISSDCGVMTTTTSVVQFNSAPVFTQQPVGTAACNGDEVTVTATVDNADSYQWFLDGQPFLNFPGFIIPGLDESFAGDYVLEATNSCGTVSSNVASVILNEPLAEFTQQPQTPVFCSGGGFSLNAETNNVVSVQWLLNGNPISGATANAYNVPFAGSTDEGTYVLEATDVNGCKNQSNPVEVGEAGIIHHFPLDNASGADIIGTNTATFTGTGTEDRFGNPNKATHINQSQLNINAISTDKITVSMWIRREFFNNNANPVLIGTANNPSFAPLVIYQNQARVGVRNNGADEIGDPAAGLMSWNIWTHIIWSADGSQNKIYVNGDLVLNTMNGVNPSLHPIIHFASIFRGGLDDIKVFNFAVSDEEAQLIYGMDPLPSLVQLDCANPALELTANPSATSLSNLEYQWYFNGNPMNGQTNQSLVIPTIAASSAGEYFVEVNVEGSCVSEPSNITEVQVDATGLIDIVSQPSEGTSCEGSNHLFSVMATGDITSYQWRKDGINIPGANDDTYFLTGASASDIGSYDVQISGACGTVTSDLVDFDIEFAPSIITDIFLTTACTGESVSFPLTVQGEDLVFEWFKDGNPLLDGFSSTYTIPSVTMADAGNYQAEISNFCGSVTSNAAPLSVSQEVTINVQPVGGTICEGNDFTLTCIPSSGGTVASIKWLKDGVELQGANTLNYTLSNMTPEQSGSYQMEIISTCGSTLLSNVAEITVNPATVINEVSTNAACIGQSVSLSASASGQNLGYQWSFDGTPLTGAIGSSISIASASAANEGDYTIEVTGTCGTVVSDPITITLNDVPSFDVTPTAGVYCQGEEVDLIAQITNNPTSVQWLNGGVEVQNTGDDILSFASISPSDAGDYEIIATNECGSQTSAAFSIVVNPTFEQTILETLCFGEVFTINNVDYDQEGEYTIVLSTTEGCDSTIFLELSVLPEITNAVTATICDGETFEFGTQTITAAGEYVEVFSSQTVCDSTVTLTLEVIDPSETFSVAQSICFGESFEFGTQTLTESGSFTETFTATYGCDSTVVLNLTVEDEIDVALTVEEGVVTVSQMTGASYVWIDCDNDNIPISGEVSNTFTPDESGNYAVLVTINDCEEMSECVFVESAGVGVKDINAQSISVFPNPTNSIITVELSDNFIGTKIQLTNSVGQILETKMVTSNNVSYDLQNFADGIYFIQLHSEKGLVTKKVIKN